VIISDLSPEVELQDDASGRIVLSEVLPRWSTIYKTLSRKVPFILHNIRLFAHFRRRIYILFQVSVIIMKPTDSDPVEAQPQPFNANKLEPAKKRKRSLSPTHASTKRTRSKSPTDPPQHAPSPSSEAPKRKRPTGRARITDAEREVIRQRQLEREKELEAATAPRGIHDAVREHYNAVPERGRDWRKTDSRIKGLRAFNNWVKSTLIQKFSPNEDYTPGAQESGGMRFAAGPDLDAAKGLYVLDMGCGKGGDLGKWQQAPQRVDLYVGLDPANVSIEQARERYRQMASRGGGRGGRGGRGGGYNNRPQPRLFHGEFVVQDCFGESIERVPIVKEVGFDPSGGPSRFGGGGFDVVTMMFCLHYAFESEEKARQMLRNVAGALKKGGRLIGCIPNSDVLSEKVEQFNARQAEKKKAENGDKESKANGDAGSKDVEDGEIYDTAEWGNDIYRVRFPGKTPQDGIFRPPYGWKYNYFLHEAVEEVPEYVVPWEAFRAIAEDYNLEMQYHKRFDDIWKAEKDDEVLGPLSERMGVRERNRGPLLVSQEEMEAASFYVGFCFYKV
jgi:mRNA (guanine-N7-)-methyltransferase